MKRFFSIVLIMVMLGPVLTGNSFAAVQTIAAGTEALNPLTGQVDGVSFTGAATATVTDGQPLNSNNLATGVLTSADNQGNLVFAGSSVVSGAIGTALASLNTITANGSAGTTVSFLGNVWADTNTILTGTGTISFGGNYVGTTLYGAGATGTITLAVAKSMTGAINNTVAGEGTLTLGAASFVTGAVGNVGIGLAEINLNGASSYITGATGATTINMNGASSYIGGATRATTINMASTGNYITGTVTATNLNLTGGDATITGATAVTNFDLNGYRLTMPAGTLTVPALGTISLDAASGTSYGNILLSAGLATVTAGATATVNVTGFVPNGAQLTIVNGTVGGGASVAPNLVVTSSSPNVLFTSNTAAGPNWILTAARTNVATTPQGAAVTTSINSIGAATGDLSTVLTALDLLPTAAAVSNAVSQLDPTNNGAMTQGVFNTINASKNTLTTHLGEYGNYPAPGRSGIRSRGDASSRQKGVSTGDFWTDNGVWVKSFGDRTEQDAHNGVNGYDSSMWGVIGGVDGIVSNDVLLGVAGGYAATDIGNKEDGGGTDIDSYIGTIYVSYDNESPWYADMGFLFTWNSYDSTRRIEFPGINRTAQSSPDGQTYTGFADLGYVIPISSRWNVTPMTGLTYSHTNIDNYTETGAGDLSLNVDQQNYEQLLLSLGVRVDATVHVNYGKWVPEVHFRWLYDFIGDQVATNSTFTGGGSTFSTQGLEPEQSTYNLGAGLTFYSKGNVSLTGTYDYQFGTDYASHTGMGVVRYTF